MTEQELKNPNGVENKPSQEITQEDLDHKIDELGLIEQHIFNGDGKIGGNSKDTAIDKTYNESIKKATDIKTKLKIVEELIVKFKTNYDGIATYVSMHKSEMDKDEKTKEIIVDFKKELYDLLNTYPGHADTISYYFNNELSGTNVMINCYKEEFEKTGNKENLNAIPLFTKQIYQNYSRNIIPAIKKDIESLSKIPQIKNKEKFFSYYMKNDYFKYVGEEGLGNRLQKLFNIDFISNGFSDDDKDDNNSDKFAYGTLSVLIEVGMYMSRFDEINELYKNPNKKEELIKYLESLPLNQKSRLLEIKVFKDILVEVKTTHLKLNKNIRMDDDVKKSLLYLSFLSERINKKEVENLIVQFLNAGKEESFKEFLEKGGKFEKLLLVSDNVVDQYYLIKIFEAVSSNISSNGFECKVNPFYHTFLNIIDQKISLIEKKIIDKKEKLKDQPKELFDFEQRLKVFGINLENPNLKQTGIFSGEKLDNEGRLQEVFKIISDYTPNTSDKTKDTLKKDDEKTNISKEKKQEMQQKMDKLGLKAKVTDEGKMVGEKGEETFSQKIGNKSQIEINTNGELILVNSLGYKMKYEHNDIGLEKTLETSETFDYLNRIGLGYFGSNFKEMLESIKYYLPNQVSYLSIDEKSGNFLNMRELNEIIIPIFKNVGFIDNSQNLDYLAPEEVTDTIMSHRLSKVNGGESFIKGKHFNKIIFGELLQQTNKVL